MKNLMVITLLTASALWLAACGGTTSTNTSNAGNTANANATKAAAPTKEALLEMDKKANEAWVKGDGKYFEGFLSDKFVSFDRGTRMGKADVAKMIGEFKCDMKSWSLDDPQMAKINDDTYVLSYKGTFDGSCIGPDGKSEKIPSPIRAASVYVRDGENWKGAFHGETAIIEPKAPAAPAAALALQEPKKEGAMKDDKMASNDAMKDDKMAESKPVTGDANTEALVKIHTSGWEAWKAKDAKKLEEITASNLANVNPAGMWIGTKAAVIKQWTETMKCEGITSVKVTDGVATAISPTVEILTLKGTADGTCDGQKNGPLYQTAVYVKEGDAWKLAFMFESPAA
ncbi:MAG: nuclear transport factor 2 family protein [Pyrinomonadaceae bacterium]